MPRSGGGLYSLPAGLPSNGDVSDATDITVPFADLETDMNTARPIVAGGTGATSASAALINFGLTATAAEINILDGATLSTAELNILDGVTASTAELNILDGATLTVAELNYVDGVTSAIQTQLDAKAPAAALHTIWLPAGAFTPTTTNGAAYASQELATNDVMVTGFDFSASTDQKVQAIIAMPKSWNESTVTAQVLWKDATTAGTGDVRWGIRALSVGNDDALDAAFGTAVFMLDTFIAAGDLHISPTSSAVTAAGTPAEGDLLIVEVYRDADDAADTYTQLARFMGLRLFYTVNAGTDA